MKKIKIACLLIIFTCLMITPFESMGQELRKVRAKKRIVAYDIQGKVIDSLSKDLSKQADISQKLDRLQVELRQIELELKDAGADSKNMEEAQKKKEDLLSERLESIKQIQADKDDLVKEYYVIIESFKKRSNARKALQSWHNKGYKVFLFENKLRKWYYICVSVQRSYERAVKKQFELKKDGVDSWIYYWAE